MYWTLTGNKDETILKNEMTAFEEEWKDILSGKGKLEKDKKILKISTITLIIGVFLIILDFTILFSQITFYIGLVVAIISIIVYTYLKNLYKEKSKDFLKMEIAKENNWFYAKNKSTADQRTLEQKIPEIFKRGNTGNRYVDDQYFGTFDIQDKQTAFHFGNFYYEIESGSGDDRHTTPYPNNFFAFKLNKPLENKFIVYPEGIFSKIGNMFSKKDVDLESIEFNKKFSFSYKESNTKSDISKIFKPSLQLKFLELVANKKGFSVLFDKEQVIFLFSGFLVPYFKTDITKTLEINPEDKQKLTTEINFLKSIMSEIIKSVN